MQLADANTRLQEEMSERDSARRELDQQNERMMGELRKRSDRATMLAKMGELLQSCVALDEVVAASLGFAPKIFPAARGSMALLNASRSLAEVIGSWTDCRLPEMEFEPTACWALADGASAPGTSGRFDGALRARGGRGEYVLVHPHSGAG